MTARKAIAILLALIGLFGCASTSTSSYTRGTAARPTTTSTDWCSVPNAWCGEKVDAIIRGYAKDNRLEPTNLVLAVHRVCDALDGGDAMMTVFQTMSAEAIRWAVGSSSNDVYCPEYYDQYLQAKKALGK